MIKIAWYPNLLIDQGSFNEANIYDSTNGTISPGDIQYLAPFGFMSAGLFSVGSGFDL